MREPDDELGSGEFEYTHGRVVVHFGSPQGTTYKPIRRKSVIAGASRSTVRGRRNARNT